MDVQRRMKFCELSELIRNNSEYARRVGVDVKNKKNIEGEGSKCVLKKVRRNV